ncbi:MAG: hypothetical protein JWN92_3071 [Candidatus Acidoferrum typicum]|nr:hypothetical protein [Candidatus Acidoferrum typicum]
MFKKLGSLFLAFLLLVASTYPQGATSKIRSAASLPATCTSSSANVAADIIVVSSVFYKCGPAANTWSRLDGQDAVNVWSASQRFKGPTPFTDITGYGARAVNSLPQTRATISAGSHNASLASPSTLQNGDGFTIQGAGSTNTMATPGAPTVTPSIASAGTTTGLVVSTAAASTTYSYKCMVRDKLGALTAAGPATLTTTGQATLGVQTATITTATLSKDVITFNTSTTTPIRVDSRVDVTGTSVSDFDGRYIVATVGSGTFTVKNVGIDSRGIGWKASQYASSSGGTVTYIVSNHVVCPQVMGAWEYFLYGGPGVATFNLIGQSRVNGDTWVETFIDDYGPTYMANQLFPSYVPTTAPSVATNDPLTTTIVSGGGTTSLVLEAAAANSVTGATALFDDGPAILAAATTAAANRSTLFIPPSGFSSYWINSFLLLPNTLNVRQIGNVIESETMELQDSTTWSGDWSANGTAQFGTSSNVFFNTTANPGIYTNGLTLNFSNIGFATSATNGGTLLVMNNVYQGSFDNVTLYTGRGGAAGDYLSAPLVLHSYNAGGNNFHFSRTLFTSGPSQTQTSWTPIFHMPTNQDGSGNPTGGSYFVTCEGCFFNRRGIEVDRSGQIFNFYGGGYRQGGITPFFTFVNNNGFSTIDILLNDFEQDTETAGTVALWSLNGAFANANINMISVNNATQDVNGIPPPFTGNRPGMVWNFGGSMGTLPTRGTVNNFSGTSRTYPYSLSTLVSPAQETHFQLFEPTDFPAGHPLFWDLGQPSNISAGAATAGGSLTASTTYFYLVTAVGVDGGETTSYATPSSSATTTTNKTIHVTWTGVAGALGYNVYHCYANCTLPDGRPRTGNYYFVANTSGASYSDTFNGNPIQPPGTTGTGLVGLNATEIYSPRYITTSPLVSGVSHTATDTAPITADHLYKKPDMDGTYALDLSGTTSTIIGTALTATCDSGTVAIAGAVAGMPVHVSTTDGTDLGGAFNVRASVTTNGTVTIYVCGTGTPPTKAYNVRVIK